MKLLAFLIHFFTTVAPDIIANCINIMNNFKRRESN